MPIAKYAQLTRAHTAPLEAVPALVGALLATGGSITLQVIGWGVFGVLYHLTGYGMNSYTDWKSGHDRDDPNKQHHPLNTGEIRELDAIMFIWLIALFTASLAVILSLHSVIGIALIFAMVFFGSMYNYVGKKTTLKFIPISIAHTLVFVIPYITLGGEINTIFLMLTLYVFLWIVFQISVSGELKDFWSDEANFLKKIRRSGRLWSIGVIGILYSLSVKGLSLWIIVEVSKPGYYLPTLVIAMTGGIFSFLLVSMLKVEERRDSLVQTMSMIEAIMLFALLSGVAHIIGPLVAIALAAGSVAWVVIFNMLEWGTILSPKV